MTERALVAVPRIGVTAIPLVLSLAALLACDSKDPLALEEVNPTQIVAAEAATGNPSLDPVRPFQARLSGSMYVLGVCAEGAGVVAQLHGSGTATHLGHFTLDATACTSMTPGAGWYGEVTGTLTAANGDQIALFLSDTGVSPDGWELNDFQVTGGTGRFAGAAGEVHQRVRLTTLPDPPNPGLWISTMEGWIAY